jgi:phosphatidylglycerophosphate synthase
LILRASDQVVHFPLVDAVRGGGARIAITPDGDYAGAIWVPAEDVSEAATVLAADPSSGDLALAKRWRESKHATEQVHGEIARHRAVTKEERRAATKMLFGVIYKKQDGPLSKILFRPIAYPITRAFLPTPITPNHVTAIAAILALTGCAIVTGVSYQAAVIGSLMQHIAGYFDCTDGEIARLRHEGSKLGQWFDTLADEATTVAYLGCIGYHVYLRHPGTWYQPYIGWGIPLGLVASLTSVYVIYYYLIKVARSGNSQDYPVKKGGTLEPIAWVVQRDFVGLVTLVLAVLNLTEVAFAGLLIGSLGSAATLVPEHLQLRKDLASGRVVPKPR